MEISGSGAGWVQKLELRSLQPVLGEAGWEQRKSREPSLD